MQTSSGLDPEEICSVGFIKLRRPAFRGPFLRRPSKSDFEVPDFGRAHCVSTGYAFSVNEASIGVFLTSSVRRGAGLWRPGAHSSISSKLKVGFSDEPGSREARRLPRDWNPRRPSTGAEREPEGKSLD